MVIVKLLSLIIKMLWGSFLYGAGFGLMCSVSLGWVWLFAKFLTDLFPHYLGGSFHLSIIPYLLYLAGISVFIAMAVGAIRQLKRDPELEPARRSRPAPIDPY